MIESPADGINVREAARRLGVSYQSVHNWIRAGLLPASRFGPTGRIIRIDPEDLQKVRQPQATPPARTPGA